MPFKEAMVQSNFVLNSDRFYIDFNVQKAVCVKPFAFEYLKIDVYVTSMFEASTEAELWSLEKAWLISNKYRIFNT